MPQPLIAHIEQFVPLSTEDKAFIEASTRINTLKKKEFLFNQGQVCPANYFVVSGCLRLYIQNEKGVEQMIQFGIDNWWITDYMSLTTGRPSVFCLQAVENSTIIALDNPCRNTLLEAVPALERYFRLVQERAMAAAQMRIHFIFSYSGRERYNYFSTVQPAFTQRIPQYMLASYLGISAEFLSRLRAEKE